MPDIKQRLLDACNGHPAAEIPWPHRLLHDAHDHIVRLEACAAQREAEVAHWKAEVAHWKNVARLAIAAGENEQTKVGRLEKQVEILRQYGNKDCTAMADEALALEPQGGEEK